MKKLFFILSALAVGLVGCDPLNETFRELDAVVPDPTAAQSVELTLTDDDYEWLEEEYGIASFGNFDSDDQAREYIPFLLSDLFPALGEGSSALVTYDLYRGSSDKARAFSRANDYGFTSNDYYAIAEAVGDAGFVNNNYDKNIFIPEILDNNIDSLKPQEGDLIAVQYEWADKAYDEIAGVAIVNESFETTTDFDQYTTVSLDGDQVWKHGSFSGDGYAGMSGYSGGNVPNTDWLIIDNIDLSAGGDPKMSVRQVLNYLGAGVIGQDIAVKVSTDYAGDVTTATWTNLDADVWPSGTSWTPVTSTFDLAAYDGQTITIGFYYNSTADYAPNWQVSEIDIEVGEPVETFTQFEIYEYINGVWSDIDNVVYLDDEEYDAMGAPGRFNNFSRSVSPDDYLPAYLELNFPYAQEDEEFIVIYKYFSSGVQTRGDLYTFMNGEFHKYESVVSKTLQFGVEDGVWVPDNTVPYTLTGEDYDAIAQNEELGNENGRSNLATYGNFNVNSGYWSEDDIIEAVSFILMQKFPDIMEEGQKFSVTYNTYPLGNQVLKLIYMDGQLVKQP